MERLCLAALLCALAAGPAAAQIVPLPELQNRIPAPLPPPPPPQPPVINGPLTEGQQGRSRIYPQPDIDTAGDRVTRCLHDGAGNGLSGARLDAYTRRCANAH